MFYNRVRGYSTHHFHKCESCDKGISNTTKSLYSVKGAKLAPEYQKNLTANINIIDELKQHQNHEILSKLNQLKHKNDIEKKHSKEVQKKQNLFNHKADKKDANRTDAQVINRAQSLQKRK
jgi:hypothetical protein